MLTDNSRALLTLKIDVDTFRGTREGVPNLVRLLSKYQAHATFLFSMGPDHTGRALKRALRPGFFSKVARTSVLEHYGLKTLLYGTLLPGPDIGLACAEQMRQVQAAGFECGIHTWDHVLWQDHVATRDPAWTNSMMRRAAVRYQQVFGAPAHTHGAAGWQMNGAAFNAHEQSTYRYASDGRAMLNDDGSLLDPASGPHRLADSYQVHSCIQLPTTLPTLDELLGREINGVVLTTSNVAAHILSLTADNKRDHVYTLHAELEGQKLAPVFEELLLGWTAQAYKFASMADYYEKIKDEPMPISPITWGEVPGRSGQLIVQGKAA